MPTGSSTDNGIQQVSIFPYQELKSYLGNEVLYGFFDEGVYNSSIDIGNSSDPNNLNFYIGAGTTLVFKRSVTDNSGNLNTFLGKIVLTQTATITQAKDSIWRTSTPYSTSNKLYIVADWKYDTADPTTIYAKFTLETDTSIVALKLLNGTASHILIVGTVLNHQSCVSQLVASIGPGYPNGNINAVVWPINSAGGIGYHTTYDTQTNRNLMKRATSVNSGFSIDFDPLGNGVYVNPGVSFVSGSLLNPLTISSKIVPAVSTATPYYIPNLSTGVRVAITTNLENYAQIDVLRLKNDELTHTTSIVWESFVKLLTLVSPFIAGFPNYPMVRADLKLFLSSIELPLVGEGKTLMIVVRNLSVIPPTNSSSRIVWPENCVILNEETAPVPSTGTSKFHNRFKLPVWESVDIFGSRG